MLGINPRSRPNTADEKINQREIDLPASDRCYWILWRSRGKVWIGSDYRSFRVQVTESVTTAGLYSEAPGGGV